MLYRAIYWIALLGGIGFGAGLLIDLEAVLANGDFPVFYAAARTLADGGALTELYDFRSFSALSHLPFVYPPLFALLVEPLALMDAVTAFLAWGGTGLLCLTLGLLPLGLPWWLVLVLVINPCTMLIVAHGQVETFFMLPLLLSVGQLTRQTSISGASMALESVKPQMGVLPGLLALWHGRWSALFIALAFTATLTGLSVLWQGVDAWRAFLEVGSGFTQRVIQHPHHLSTALSPYAVLASLGTMPWVHWPLVGIAATAVWLSRNRLSTSEAIFTLTCLALMVPPYLLSKALIVFVASAALSYQKDRQIFRASFCLATLAAPLWFALAPVTSFPFVALMLPIALAWIIWRALFRPDCPTPSA